ncbi:MAG TPA: AAA family ATPase [Candidatus Binatia bacterium]|nr:AAA family ATPase [Candidatus Binatia bacterium]
MKLLYQEYFGFKQAPFNVTPDPGFLYLSASHREGLAQISYGIKAHRGFIVLTGEVGTGKTTLIHALLKDLDGNTQTALLFSAIMNSLDLLRCVCEEFNLVEPLQPAREAHDYLSLLNEFLLQNYRKGQTCALIIDEAQNLSAEVLESIRLLSNFETPTDKLLQILLVGQPELAVRINRPGLRQLKQRVTLRYQLRPLSLQECENYVANRLRIAGGPAGLFTKRALESIYIYSGGVPRLINVLGDNALLTAFAVGKKEVDNPIIREVAEDLALSNSNVPVFSPPEQPLQPRPDAVRGPRVEAKWMEPKGSGPQNSQGNAPVGSVLALNQGNVPVRFFDALVAQLTEGMGPMANIVLRDQIRVLGHRIESFPKTKLAKLIESTSQEILDASLRHEFLKTASKLIKNLQRTPLESERADRPMLNPKQTGPSQA